MKKPLAYRMRPTSLNQVIGQEHLTTKDGALHQMLLSQRLQSMILYGDPSTGKTSLATAIVKDLKLPARFFDAATDSKNDLVQFYNEAKMYDELVIIIDEIHRLDKSKQDFLLPLIEEGIVTIIGTTTENPYLSVNPAIRSRVLIYELKKLSIKNNVNILRNALNNTEQGLGNKKIQVTDEILVWISQQANGDIRYALNLLELAIKTHKTKQLTKESIKPLLGMKHTNFDKNSTQHYDLLSAFQKSIRGSDVDAALHYLARLIKSNDLESIYRRLIVTSYEDIGLANPQAQLKTLCAIDACQRIGLPEARIILANIVIDLCLSPKSNSSLKAIDKALADINNKYLPNIPAHLKDNHFTEANKTNYGKEYKYPHDYPNHYILQSYLPEGYENKQYFEPNDTGKYERALGHFYQEINNFKNQK